MSLIGQGKGHIERVSGIDVKEYAVLEGSG